MLDVAPTRFTQSFTLQPGVAARARSGSCFVRIHPAEGLGEIFELEGEQLVVGRDAECDLELRDDSVSRRHALIVRSGEQCAVVDQGSTNGTYVNDVRVTSQTLQPGDRVRFGNQILRFLGADHLEAQYYEAVYKVMTTDGLTQAHNKRYLLEVLDRELSRAQRTGRPLAVLMIDLDRFKGINDTYGHLAGDQVLCELCRRIKGQLRRDEVLARYGGEEFALVLVDTTLMEARVAAERLRQSIAGAPFTIPQGEISVTVSIGVGGASGKGTATTAELLDAADRQLYAAKHAGRNRVAG